MLAGPFIGSFLGVLIRRLPRGKPVVLSRSRCESCGRTLGAMELIPFLGAASSRGRCWGCGARIAPFHWQVELATTGIAAWAVLAAGDAGAGRVWANCALGWTLLALAWIDVEHGRLPDALTLPLVIAGLLVTVVLDPPSMLDHALGAVAGYAAFRLLALAYRACRGRDGLGGGDAKLLAAAGAWVGWESLNLVVVIAAVAGIATALARRRAGERLGAATSLPFGPGLALGLWLVRLHGLPG